MRIGFLYPGHAAEDDYPFMQSLLPEGTELTVVHTSVGVDAHEVDALRDLGSGERLREGAVRLRGHVEVVMWACTSGSFVFGVDGARAQAADVARTAGVPASSTSLAFVDAARQIGVTRVAVAATYPHEVSTHFDTFLEEEGIEVLSMVSHDIPTAALAGELSEEAVIELARSNDSDEAEAILLPDTAMHTARIIPNVERLLGKPVLTANQVTLWKGIDLLGGSVEVPELGVLFGGAL